MNPATTYTTTNLTTTKKIILVITRRKITGVPVRIKRSPKRVEETHFNLDFCTN